MPPHKNSSVEGFEKRVIFLTILFTLLIAFLCLWIAIRYGISTKVPDGIPALIRDIGGLFNALLGPILGFIGIWMIVRSLDIATAFSKLNVLSSWISIRLSMIDKIDVKIDREYNRQIQYIESMEARWQPIISSISKIMEKNIFHTFQDGKIESMPASVKSHFLGDFTDEEVFWFGTVSGLTFSEVYRASVAFDEDGTARALDSTEDSGSINRKLIHRMKRAAPRIDFSEVRRLLEEIDVIRKEFEKNFPQHRNYEEMQQEREILFEEIQHANTKLADMAVGFNIGLFGSDRDRLNLRLVSERQMFLSDRTGVKSIFESVVIGELHYVVVAQEFIDQY